MIFLHIKIYKCILLINIYRTCRRISRIQFRREHFYHISVRCKSVAIVWKYGYWIVIWLLLCIEHAPNSMHSILEHHIPITREWWWLDNMDMTCTLHITQHFVLCQINHVFDLRTAHCRSRIFRRKTVHRKRIC